MNDQPTVTVILPTHMRQELVGRAIDSVLGQSLQSWELLVIDDEPNPTTREIVESVRDERVRYLAHDQNRGLSAARNTGLRRARGRYVAFLDDDDAFLAEKLRLQAACLDRADDGVGVVSCFEEIRTSGGRELNRNVVLEGDVHKVLLRNDLVRMQLLMVRRVCFARVGLFDERLWHHEDFDMTLRLSRVCRFTTLREPLVRIYETAGSQSKNVTNRIAALRTIGNTHPEFRDFRWARARWERRLARHQAELGHRREWFVHMMRSITANPADLRSWIALAAGVVGGPAAHHRLGKLRGKVERGWRDRSAP